MTGTVRFVLPANWRVVAGKDELGELTCEVGTAGEALTWLAETYPAFRERVFTSDGQLGSWMVVCLDDVDIRQHAGLDTPITSEHRELRVIPALMGG